MSSPASSGVRWDERIARARTLAERHPAAAGLLEFYAALTEHQQLLIDGWAGEAPGTSRLGPLLQSLDREWLLGALRDLISWLPRVAPPHLGDATRAMRDVSEAEWSRLLDAYSTQPSDAADQVDEATRFVLEAALQPLAERVARSRPRAVHAPAGVASSPLEPASGGQRCPVCGGVPVLGVLREEGHGSKRALMCGLCLTEWDYLRLVCPACGEQEFESLPVFTAEQFPHVRIEACEDLPDLPQDDRPDEGWTCGPAGGRHCHRVARRVGRASAGTRGSVRIC